MYWASLEKNLVIINTIKRYSPRSLLHLFRREKKGIKKLLFVKGHTFLSSIRSFFILNINLKNKNSLSLLFRNQRGLTLFAPLIITLFFSLGTLFILNALDENSKVKERKEAYLCLKQYEASRRSYISSISTFNTVINGFFYLSFIPPTAPYFKKMHKMLKLSQQIYHVAHLQKPFFFSFCPSLISIPYYKSLPYKTKAKVVLVRRRDGTAPLRKKKWSEYLWSKKKRLFFKSSFTLKNRFASAPKVKRQELSKAALYNLKDLFGLPF